MTPAARFELVLVLMAAVVALELLARRLRLPPAAALIVGGISLALIPGAPDIELDPDLALVLFLPPLLLASAYFTVWRDFRANLRIILQLAIGAVGFTTLVVGAVAHWVVPTMPWAVCFTLGAIVSPPDAVAAKAVLQRLTLPPRVTVLLEGESLINDASGLVLYRFAVAAALTGTFEAGHAALSFVALAVGGCVVGGLFGWLVTLTLSRLPDAALSVIVSFLAAWAAYILGEALLVSGVLATVTCGLVVGWRQHSVLSAATRIEAKAVWGVMVFTLESLVFILIGLSLRGVVTRLGGNAHALLGMLPAAGAIVAAVVLSRFVWIIPATYLPRVLIPSLRRRDPYPPFAVPIVMSWAGMRGVVSLAAALALPQAFPERDFILVATFGVIFATVLVQGATLAPLVHVLRLGAITPAPTTTLSEAEARARMAAVQLAAVERRSADANGTHRHPRLVEQYGFRARATERFSKSAGALVDHRREHFSVVLSAVTAGRAELLRLHHDGEIHDDVLHALEQELDLEEVSAARFLDDR